MKDSQVKGAYLCLCIVALSIFISGCAVRQYWNEKKEKERAVAFSVLRQRITPSLLMGTIGFIGIALLGPTVAERVREAAAKQFRLRVEAQIKVALWVYWAVVGVIALLALGNQHLQQVKPSVFLLLTATSFPFFVHVIPSLKQGDRAMRKAGMAQIKSFLMLILVFYVIMRMLTPQGLGFEPCKICFGHGRITCPKCGGTGATGWLTKQQCVKCRGKNEVICPDCDGSGRSKK